VRTRDPDCFTYIEHGSKNRSGGLAQLHLENKCVPCYAVPENIPECLVFLLNFYLSKLPEFAFKEDILYCRAKQKAPADDESPWYDPVPVGKNKLGNMVRDMCEDAQIPHKTNHSLRATGTTTMFQSNVPENIIQKTTGHRSTSALRMYERISAEQHQAVSRVMMSSKPTSFPAQMECSRAVETSQMTVKNVAANPGSDLQRVFGDLTNCTIGKITININPAVTVQQTAEEEFDEIVKSLEF